MPLTIPFYTKKDRVGRHYTCGCVARGHAHNFCQNCLILVGEGHEESLLFTHTLPTLTDVFNDESGVWLRNIINTRGTVCFTCHADFNEGRWEPTLRLAPVQPAVRRDAVLAWHEERGLRPPRKRHVGGFVRVQGEPSDDVEHVSRPRTRRRADGGG